jgi:hypothetical protein
MFDLFVSPQFIFFARLCLGGVFLVSAIAKMMDREGTAVSMGRYPFLPGGFGRFIAYTFPVLELAVAIMLILGLFTRLTAVMSIGMYLLFTVLITYDLTRGSSQSCHCFGRISAEKLTPVAVVRNIALMLMSALVAISFNGWLAADATLDSALGGGLPLLADRASASQAPPIIEAVPVSMIALFAVVIIVLGEQAISMVRATLRGVAPR